MMTVEFARGQILRTTALLVLPRAHKALPCPPDAAPLELTARRRQRPRPPGRSGGGGGDGGGGGGSGGDMQSLD